MIFIFSSAVTFLWAALSSAQSFSPGAAPASIYVPTSICWALTSAWRADYYNSASPGGTLVASECLFDPLARDYAAKAVPAGVKPDAFSVRYSTTMKFANDGIAKADVAFKGKGLIKVDGAPVAFLFKNAESAYGNPGSSVGGAISFPVKQGTRAVTIDYTGVEAPGYAAFAFKKLEPKCKSGEWKAAFFKGTSLAGEPVFERCDAAIDFDWNGASAAAGLPATNWSARWTKVVSMTAGDATKFTVKANDGVRVKVGDATVLNWWSGATAGEVTKGYFAATGGTREVRVEYWNGVNAASFIKVGETACPGNVVTASLAASPSGQDSHKPFFAKVDGAACVGIAKRLIFANSALVKSCAGATGECKFEQSAGYPGATAVKLRAEVHPLAGAPKVVTQMVKLETCFDGDKNGNETGVDCGGTCVWACVESFAVAPKWSSDPMLANVNPWIQKKFTDGSDVNADNTGHLPHKINYTWRFFAGHDVGRVRFRFDKLNLQGVDGTGAAQLFISTPTSTELFTEKAKLLPGGWTPWFYASEISWSLNTTNVKFAIWSGGFSIGEVEIQRRTDLPLSAANLEATNREWYGIVAPGKNDYFVVEPETDGLHDFYVRGPAEKKIEIAAWEGAGLKIVNGANMGLGYCDSDADAGCPKVAEGSTCGNDPTAQRRDSQIMSFSLKKGKKYTVRVRGLDGAQGAYTLMVNRVLVIQDIEVDFDDGDGSDEFDWGGADNWTMRERQMKEMFLDAAESIYAATDGYVRLGKVIYAKESNGDTDVTFYNEFERAICGIDVSLYLGMLVEYCQDKNNLSVLEPKWSSVEKHFVRTGSTYAHEWMHDFPDLKDEYHDDPNPKKSSVDLCPATLMAENHADLCTTLNHNPNSGASWWSSGQGDTSTWETLMAWIIDPSWWEEDEMSYYSAEAEDEMKALGEMVTKLGRTPNPHDFRRSAVRALVKFQFENLD
ncbi:MAG: hypothetical protein HYY84_20635 [Deltaproteobacteria bacterium]|nr:hypothetical protein [Deltaproteobacteria bacterium]